MEEGYYISTFLSFGELQNILKIKVRHDHTIALWSYFGDEIKLVKYWELERITGIKQHQIAAYSKDSLLELINKLLKEEQLTLKDIKGIWGTKGIETDNKYMNYIDSRVCFHNIAHLLTSIFYSNSSPFSDKIIALALDAGPDSCFENNAYDLQYYSGAVINNGKIEFLEVESPARFWSYSYKKFGLRERSLMALATATDTEFYDFDYSKYDNITFYNEEARGNAQFVVEDICKQVLSIKKEDIGIKCSKFNTNFTEQENYISMVMKIISVLSERMVFKHIDKILSTFKLDPTETTIALAGGFALNCPTNSAILKKYKFKDYQIPPCASDTGIALGVGLAAFYPLLSSGKATVNLNTVYYGQYHGGINAINTENKKYIKNIKEITIDEIAAELENNIMIWIDGRAEIGPRALGDRSILGDPRYQEIKDKLNVVKKRQWWRPVAPLIMDEHGSEIFEDYRFSPYMLLNLNIKPEYINDLIAVAHHDGTARIQSVSSESNRNLYELLKSFYKRTGIPVLCNTSLNDAGEPIVNNINEAIQFALQKGIDAIYVDAKYKIELCREEKLINSGFKMRELTYHNPPKGLDVEQFVKGENPFGLSLEEVTYYFDNPNYFFDKSLKNEEDTKYIKKKTNEYLKKYPNGLKR